MKNITVLGIDLAKVTVTRSECTWEKDTWKKSNTVGIANVNCSIAQV